MPVKTPHKNRSFGGFIHVGALVIVLVVAGILYAVWRGGPDSTSPLKIMTLPGGSTAGGKVNGLGAEYSPEPVHGGVKKKAERYYPDDRGHR